MSRGPYKQYEYDPGISIPKTTNYYRKKRQIEEVEQDLLITVNGNIDSYENNEVIQSILKIKSVLIGKTKSYNLT